MAVRARKIALMWVPEGLEPLTSCKGYRDDCSSLSEALAKFDAGPPEAPDRRLGWLRAGTGKGAAVLNEQGILLLKAAFAEGASSNA